MYYIYILFALLSYLGLYYELDNLIELNLCIVSITLVIHYFKTKNYKKVLIHSNFFIVGYIIVYFQAYFDLHFDFIPKTAPIFFDANVISKSITYATIGLLSFLIGYCLYSKKSNHISIKNNNTSKLQYKIIRSIYVISFITYIITIDKNYLLGGYGKFQMGEIALQSVRFFNYGIIAEIALFCINRQSYYNQNYFFRFFKLPIILTILFSLTAVIAGNRYPILISIMPFFFAYAYTTKRIEFNLKYFYLLIIFSSLFFILGVLRSSDSNILSLNLSSELSNQNSISPITKELSSSIRTFNAGLSVIENGQSYLFGQTMLLELALLVPGLRSYLYGLLNIDFQYQNSSNFFSFHIYGESGNSGAGSNIVGDLYINFGLLGSIIFLLIFGMLVKFFEIKLYSNEKNIFLLLLSISYFSLSFYISRATILTPIIGIIYSYLIIKISSLFSKNEQ